MSKILKLIRAIMEIKLKVIYYIIQLIFLKMLYFKDEANAICRGWHALELKLLGRVIKLVTLCSQYRCVVASGRCIMPMRH